MPWYVPLIAGLIQYARSLNKGTLHPELLNLLRGEVQTDVDAAVTAGKAALDKLAEDGP